MRRLPCSPERGSGIPNDAPNGQRRGGVIVASQEGEDWRMEEDALVKVND